MSSTRKQMVDAFPSLLDELRHGRLRPRRLEQLDARVARGEKRGAHALGLDGLDVLDRETERFIDLCRLE